MREEGDWFVLEIPRCENDDDDVYSYIGERLKLDGWNGINGVGEDEVTVTPGLHAQAERTKKQTERRARRERERERERERKREGGILLKIP